MQNVAGVLWAEVTALGTLGAAAPMPDDARVARRAGRSRPSQAAQPDEVLALHAGHLQLALTVPATEGCN